jgi:1-deoxyxylulose-5-phosphate synthase
MKRNRLGRTGLEVSAIGLGTVELGLDYGAPGAGGTAPPPEAEATRLLNCALDRGIDFIDTARLYGTSEEIIGKAIGHRRREFTLATKVFHFAPEGLRGAALRERVFDSIHTSLRLLRTDYVDILKIHSAPHDVVVDEGLRAILEDARSQGLTRFIGASVYGEAGMAALRTGRYDCLQIAYNVLDRSAESELIPLAAQTGAGLVVRSVLLKGVLTGRYRDLPGPLAELREAAAALDSLACQAGITLAELAYRYVLSNPGCAVALAGTGRVEELEATLRFAEAGPLPSDLAAHAGGIALENPALLNPSNWPA